MKRKSTDQERAVASVKAQISPRVPCVQSDAAGYCTGPCEGAICCTCPSYKPRVSNHEPQAESIEPEVLPPLGEIENPDYTKPGERISYHISMGQYHGRVAFAHLILAGWELAVQKQAIGYGGWAAWCAGNLHISSKTADRYVLLYQKTVGAARSEAAIPLAKRVTSKELEAATVGMEGKSATRVMVDLEIIKREDWGGDRSDKAAKNGHKVGRKPKDDAAVAAELKAVAENESVIWASAKGSIDNLVQLDSGRDMFHRLSGDHLAAVAGLLADLSKKAAAALEQRLSSMGAGEMETAEAIAIIRKGL